MSIASTSSIRAKRKATIRDLHRADGKAELINGRIVQMSPTGFRPSQVAMRILLSLHSYSEATRKGSVFTDNVAFLANLPHRGSFSPDAAYYTGPIPDDPMEFLPAAPDFAVEVRSKADYGPAVEKRLRSKREDYFAAGTRVVWDVNPMKETVAVYRATKPSKATVYRLRQIAEAEPAVPAWRLPLSEIFKKG
jgi:Uma2 family endonuclease